jgi:hypothetical protein
MNRQIQRTVERVLARDRFIRRLSDAAESLRNAAHDIRALVDAAHDSKTNDFVHDNDLAALADDLDRKAEVVSRKHDAMLPREPELDGSHDRLDFNPSRLTREFA